MWNLFCRAGHGHHVQNLLWSIRRKNPPCNAEDNLRAGLIVIEAWFRGDTSILHHAFISIFIALWAFITHYISTYGYSLLFYKGYHEEGECRQLEFWLEKEQTLETYSALLQKS